MFSRLLEEWDKKHNGMLDAFNSSAILKTKSCTPRLPPTAMIEKDLFASNPARRSPDSRDILSMKRTSGKVSRTRDSRTGSKSAKIAVTIKPNCMKAKRKATDELPLKIKRICPGDFDVHGS